MWFHSLLAGAASEVSCSEAPGSHPNKRSRYICAGCTARSHAAAAVSFLSFPKARMMSAPLTAGSWKEQEQVLGNAPGDPPSMCWGLTLPVVWFRLYFPHPHKSLPSRGIQQLPPYLIIIVILSLPVSFAVVICKYQIIMKDGIEIAFISPNPLRASHGGSYI